MHQASILFTAAVLAMAGAWYVMQDASRNSAAPAAIADQPVTVAANAAPLAE